jgi:hypothetical protein
MTERDARGIMTDAGCFQPSDGAAQIRKRVVARAAHASLLMCRQVGGDRPDPIICS